MEISTNWLIKQRIVSEYIRFQITETSSLHTSNCTLFWWWILCQTRSFRVKFCYAELSSMETETTLKVAGDDWEEKMIDDVGELCVWLLMSSRIDLKIDLKPRNCNGSEALSLLLRCFLWKHYCCWSKMWLPKCWLVVNEVSSGSELCQVMLLLNRQHQQY